MKPTVELIYDQECPNVNEARRVLEEALETAGLAAAWTEWDRESPESPDHARLYGSPTILVNGKDVAGQAPSEGQNCCRVYAMGQGRFEAVPPRDAVIKALCGKPCP